jgi:hypothetical protein
MLCYASSPDPAIIGHFPPPLLFLLAVTFLQIPRRSAFSLKDILLL